MDLAYDHIQEEALPKDGEQSQTGGAKPEASSLNTDLQDAYRALSNSPWGARIGGFFGTVVKQSESVYREAQQELTAVGSEASKGLSDLRASIISRTRGLSLTGGAAPPTAAEATGERAVGDDHAAGAGEASSSSAGTGETAQAGESTETVLERIRREGAKRLKDLQQAEEAADEALLKFGSNIRDFLRDAITIAPPGEGAGGADGGGAGTGAGGATVLFESKDAQGKRVVHASRFDAQLHVIHITADSFAKDPVSDEFEGWAKAFDIDSKTDDIAADLNKYPELRATMEKLVPDQVPYAEFWKRYYFLRHGIETAEARRRDLLKAASAEEEVLWDEDSDDEAGPSKTEPKPERPGSVESSTTIHPPPAHAKAASGNLLKPSESRKSNDEKSQPDSEASYDVVGVASGVPSQAPNSPKDLRKGDESDEEDWE